jgi:hypothetical protein
MEKIYQIANKRVMFSQEMDPNIFKKDLPPGFYTTGYNDREGVFLKETDSLTIPSKIYGDSNSRLGRILNSFEYATKNLGVLLYGNSGSGKSLLAKQVCVELAKTHPVIIVNSNHIYFLNNYIENIKERCVFFIDEFEKMFEKKEDQSYMLTVIDGATTKSNLFLFTANNKSMVNDFFFNRPSRIRYAYEYSYLSEDVIKEVLFDRLDNKDRVDAIFNAIVRFDDPSFDVICELASEANLYPDYTIKQLMEGYNSRMISNRLSDLDCQFLIDGEDIGKFVQSICEKYGVTLSTSYCTDFTDYDIDDLQEMIYSSSSRKTNFCLGEYNLIINNENTVIRNDRYLYFDISNMKFNYVNKDLYINGIKLSIEGMKDFMYLISSSIAKAVKADDANSFVKEIDKVILPQLINKEFGIVAKPIKKYKSSYAF